MDIQGAHRVRPWVEKANATYPVLVDKQARVAAAFGVDYVPFAALIDENGMVVQSAFPSNIADSRHRTAVSNWAHTGTFVENAGESTKRNKAGGFESTDAELYFSLAGQLLQTGETASALVQLKNALKLEPGNWVIKKQIWAIENPERFYKGNVDYKWQRTQLESEKLAQTINRDD